MNAKYGTPERRDVDKGWAWIVLLAASLQQILYGQVYASGLFTIMFLEEFGRDRQTTGWIVSIQNGILLMSGE